MFKKLFISLFLISGSCVVLAQNPNTSGLQEKTFSVGKYTVKYVLDNRKVVHLPKIDIMTDEHGTVVIDITVDKYGNVLNATPNAGLSDTKSAYLTTKAKQAAETTHFDTTPTTPLKTKGNMTFTF